MTSADKIRERKICEAIVQVLEAQQHTARSAGFSPEDEDAKCHERERVEWVASIGTTQFALEVTLVEAIPERIRVTEHLK